ncbi:MAG: amidohydrolase [Thermoproteota archaeon]
MKVKALDSAQQADVILENGNVVTINPLQPQAQAVAVKDGKIVAVGTKEEVRKWIGENTRIIDLQGRTVVPGLIDTHVHMVEFGRFLSAVDLRGVASIKEVKERLKGHVQKTPPDKWILGHGWDQERFVEKRYPTRWDLDEVSPSNPVILDRVCGHICVVNSKALELAGITKETEAPFGGQIDKDPKTGEPTGILRENAAYLAWKLVPQPTDEELVEICSLAIRKAVEAGLTGIHWIVSSPREIRAIQKLRAQGKLLLRVYIIIPVEHLDHLVDLGLCTGFGDEMVRIGSVKIFTDGSLGARTAALKMPYNDEPTTKGIIRYTQEELNALVAKAHKAGLQLAIHAIGDEAIDMTLTALEKALTETSRDNHRHRIEHASVLNEGLMQRIKKLGVLVSAQPISAISDFWVVERVGQERARLVYALKSLIRNRIRVSGSSDCPVDPINPILGIHAAVARESFPEERLTAEEAICIYTVNGAYASFEESLKGTIQVGKLADFTVLSHDPQAIPPNEVKNIKIEMTIVGGKVVYTRQALKSEC